MPLRSGRARSSSTRSKGRSPRWSRPSWPSISSRVCRDSRISASSSIMSTQPAEPWRGWLRARREITAASAIIFTPWQRAGAAPWATNLGSSADRLANQGKLQVERGAFPRAAFHGDFARMFLNDAVGDREPQAGAAGLAVARRILGGEEGVVNAVNVLLGDALAGVADGHIHPGPVAGAHTQGAAVGHGVLGIQKQVKKHLLQLAGVALNGGQMIVEFGMHLDARGLELMFQQGKGVADDFVDVNLGEFGAAGAGEIEQVVDDFRGAESLARDFIQQGGFALVALHLLGQHL